MNDDYYFYLAVFVFSLLLIGVVLTVLEFKSMNEKD